MGHRANYVLIENGQPQIYFSRFGAMYMAETLLGGPDATKTFTCQLTRSDSLLDDIDGEGGVLLDFDNQFLLYWTDHKIKREDLQHVYSQALARIWLEWTVQWADNEMADLAVVLAHGSMQFQERDRHANRLTEEAPQKSTQAIEELIAILAENDTFDANSLYVALTQNGENVQVGEGFFDAVQPTTSGEERRLLLRKIFQP